MSRVRTVAPWVLAAALTGVAVLTVRSAGCDDPGRYVPVPGGYELVSSCVATGDLVVPDQTSAPAPPPEHEGPAKS